MINQIELYKLLKMFTPNLKIIGSTDRNKQKGLNKSELKNHLFQTYKTEINYINLTK